MEASPTPSVVIPLTHSIESCVFCWWTSMFFDSGIDFCETIREQRVIAFLLSNPLPSVSTLLPNPISRGG